VIRLNNRDEVVYKTPTFENYFLVYRAGILVQEDWDNPYSVYLLSVLDGRRRKIFDKCFLHMYAITPDERFVIWFDPLQCKYFDYEIPSGITRTLGESIAVPLFDKEELMRGRLNAAYGLCGWSMKEQSVYIYDQYDIWKVDLFDKKKPVNISAGYGREHSIVFGILNTYGLNIRPNLDTADKIIVSAYNACTKDNSLFEIGNKFGARKFEVTLDPCSYWIVRTGFIGYVQTATGSLPIRARDCKRYLVRRMNANQYPNVLVTDNFKQYKQISFIYPERKVNWIKSKLISWRKPDGQSAQGILYLPEDFDSTKKYPVIFECYEKMSDGLNQYLYPELCAGRINIPYYVSNGYLVFEPDISWSGRHMGIGVANTLVSAAEFLSTYSWVDVKKIGLQGHSFGGWVADYAVTNTHVFAAVCSAAGTSDEISEYGQLEVDGTSGERNFELGQGGSYGIGVTPWTNPSIYMENSGMFKVGDATTPLLLMHGEDDLAVPVAQAIEMYLAFRRAGKKVWLLEYEKDGHGLAQGNDAQDFTIRMKQFFDYYLKGFPAPVWMTKGVPYAKRGTGNGLELDTSGGQP
jgi:dienelactone hydrolase